MIGNYVDTQGWTVKAMNEKEFWCALFITWIYCNGDLQRALQLMGVVNNEMD